MNASALPVVDFFEPMVARSAAKISLVEGDGQEETLARPAGNSIGRNLSLGVAGFELATGTGEDYPTGIGVQNGTLTDFSHGLSPLNWRIGLRSVGQRLLRLALSSDLTAYLLSGVLNNPDSSF